MIPVISLMAFPATSKPRASGDDPEHYDIEVYSWE